MDIRSVFGEDYFCSLFRWVRIEGHLPGIGPFRYQIQIFIKCYRRTNTILHNWKYWCIISKYFYVWLTSFGYIINKNKEKRGPNIEPWGTPARMFFQFEVWPLSTTLWNLLVKKLFIKIKSGPLIPYDLSLYNNLCLWNVSNEEQYFLVSPPVLFQFDGTLSIFFSVILHVSFWLSDNPSIRKLFRREQSSRSIIFSFRCFLQNRSIFQLIFELFDCFINYV